MTGKEAIEMIVRNMNIERDYSHPRLIEAWETAIEALGPWKKLSEEEPKTRGNYVIWRAGEHSDGRPYGFWCEGVWCGRAFNEVRSGCSVEDVTHWREINGPEEEK